MLRHQHHSMQNQLRDNKFAPNIMMGGPVRPPMPQPQILSVHHMHHSVPPGGNPRQPMLLGVNAPNQNGIYKKILTVACLFWVLLSGVDGNDHRPFLNITLDNLDLLFGPTGCIEGTMVTIGLNRNMEPLAAIQSQTLQQQYQQHQQQQQQQQQQQPSLQPGTQQLNQQSQHENMQQQSQIPGQILNQKKLSNHEDNSRVDSGDESPSARPTNPNPANVTNAALANMKEKTPMCLVNELARFNKLQHQYRLTNEQGPAHKKCFTVTLKLGEEEYVAEGQSIKKAQHSAATSALTKTWYRHPPPKPTRAMRIGHLGKGSNATGNLPPTVELNALAMKRGELTVYTIRHAPPAAPQQYFPHVVGNIPRIFNPHYPPFNHGYTPKQEKLYLVTLKVGDREFVGRGVTGQAARHDAASRALEQLRQLPIPEECPTSATASTVAAMSAAALTENGITTTLNPEDTNAEIKSPVSLVHETALKRGLPVSFKVVFESGKPHIRTFTTKCKVGEKVTVGEGPSKKVSKKRAAEMMLDELKRLPPIPAAITPRAIGLKRKSSNAKRPRRNLIRDNQGPRNEVENIEEVDPISRLVQIQQSKREREPVYTLVEEKGGPRKREFLMEVTIGQYSAQGIGSNKKSGKRAAAEALLTQLGYGKPALPAKPSIKTTSKDANNVENNDGSGKPRKVTFLEDDAQTSREGRKNKHRQSSTGGSIGRQLVPGLLLVDGASQQDSKLMGTTGNATNNGRPGSPNSPTGPTLQAVADALRGQQHQQQTSNGLSPKDQLMYLAKMLNFKATFVDFPKGSYNSCLSLVSLSTDPPQVCHGNGATINDSRNQAVLTALRTLGKLGLDTSGPIDNDHSTMLTNDTNNIHEQMKKDVINQVIDK